MGVGEWVVLGCERPAEWGVGVTVKGRIGGGGCGVKERE